MDDQKSNPNEAGDNYDRLREEVTRVARAEAAVIGFLLNLPPLQQHAAESLAAVDFFREMHRAAYEVTVATGKLGDDFSRDLFRNGLAEHPVFVLLGIGAHVYESWVLNAAKKYGGKSPFLTAVRTAAQAGCDRRFREAAGGSSE